jgi:LysR family transcriptional regulator, positive regulator for ilvC
MDHANYRTFLHLAESLNFARSARQLHMSASALTRAIQRLEEELGQRLFERDHRTVSMTPAGQRFRQFARDQVAAWDALQQELSQEGVSPSGELRIACTVSACYSVLPRLVAECRVRFPRISLKLATQDATRSMEQLLLGESDVAVVPLPDTLPNELASTVLGHTDLVFIAPTESTEWLELLSRRQVPWSQVPFVAQLGGLERERLDNWFARLAAQPPIHAEVRGNEGIIALVAMGCGVGLVPELVLDPSPQAARVQRLPKAKPPRGYSVGLCVRKRALDRAPIRAFWELAQAGNR